MKLFNENPVVASFWPSTVFSSYLYTCVAVDCKLLWLFMWRSETHLHFAVPIYLKA